jgi:carbon starvation protein
MLAGIALSVATTILLRTGRAKHVWVTALPLAWLALVTTVASWDKLTSENPKIGFLSGATDLAHKLAAGALPPEKAVIAAKLIFNQRLDALITAFFLCVLWAVIADTVLVAWRVMRGTAVRPSWEAAYRRSELPEATNA